MTWWHWLVLIGAFVLTFIGMLLVQTLNELHTTLKQILLKIDDGNSNVSAWQLYDSALRGRLRTKENGRMGSDLIEFATAAFERVVISRFPI